MPDVDGLFWAVVDLFRRQPIWVQRLWLVWWLLGFVLLFLTVRFSDRAPEPAAASPIAPIAAGRIVHPLSGAWVPREVLLRGAVDGLLPQEHAYLAVRDGDHYWPKAGRLQVSRGPWEAQIVERGDPPDGHFSVVLFIVDDRGRPVIDAWLARADPDVVSALSAGELHGFRELDHVSLRLIPGTPHFRS